jgi:hypothetical protein
MVEAKLYYALYSLTQNRLQQFSGKLYHMNMGREFGISKRKLFYKKLREYVLALLLLYANICLADGHNIDPQN